MENDRDVERLLEEDGDQWRRGAPTGRRIDPSIFQDGFTGRRVPSWRGLVASSVALGILVAAIGISALPRVPSVSVQTDTIDAGATPLGTASGLPVVRPGDDVVATGYLAAHKGELYLCPSQFVVITGGIGCVPNLVRVRGGDIAGWSGLHARVKGIWDGEAVRAKTATPVSPPAEPSRPPIACDPPMDGWPGLGSPAELDAASRALEREIEQHPERFVGWWPATISEGSGDEEVKVAVVGTVDDVQSVTAELADVFPFNLCVEPVDFSRAQLQATIDSLANVDPDWRLQIEPSVGRVVIRATVLTPDMATALLNLLDKVDLTVTVHPAEANE